MIAKISKVTDPHTWTSLKSYYSNTKIVIDNNGDLSDSINTTVGVKQGGPLSPFLFSLYTEELIEILQSRKNHGTALNTGVIMYADDIMIVANKKWKINAALNICQRYGDENQIKWNPTKTQFMEINKGIKQAISAKESRTDIVFCGTKIHADKQIRYLGTEISSKMKSSIHVNKRRESTIKTVFSMSSIGLSKRELSSETRGYLYKTLARPVLTYGLEPLVITTSDKKKKFTTEGNLVKGLLGLSRNSKTKNLLGAVGIYPILKKIKISKLTFMENLSRNKFTSNLLNFSIANSSNRNINKSFADEVIEIIKEYKEHDEPILFHGPEPENYEVSNTPTLEWIIKNLKSTVSKIKHETKVIMYNNGLTDSIKNTLKMKDKMVSDENNDLSIEILGTLYLLVKSFSISGIT